MVAGIGGRQVEQIGQKGGGRGGALGVRDPKAKKTPGGTAAGTVNPASQRESPYGDTSAPPTARSPTPPNPLPERQSSAINARLVEEDVLAVSALRSKLLEHAVLVDAVLQAELFPELGSYLVAALPHL